MRNDNTRIYKAEMAMGEGVGAFAARSGAVMLEYVIVVGALAIGLMAFMSNAVFDPVRGFGPLGQALVASYQRTFGCLSLPIP